MKQGRVITILIAIAIMVATFYISIAVLNVDKNSTTAALIIVMSFAIALVVGKLIRRKLVV